jgi:hypothetical protein
VIFLNFNHTPNHIRGAMRHLITHLFGSLPKARGYTVDAEMVEPGNASKLIKEESSSKVGLGGKPISQLLNGLQDYSCIAVTTGSPRCCIRWRSQIVYKLLFLKH